MLTFTLVLSFLLIKSFRRFRFHRRPAPLTKVDLMDGVEFELYMAELLRRKGYTNVSLTERFDSGVDIIAVRHGVRWGIQVKRYKGLVKADAVRQVVTALKLYDCQQGMVVTNSTFSEVAKRLAKSNKCVLIDRSQLAQFILDAT